jgi:ketosteroid isomerase-like protein
MGSAAANKDQPGSEGERFLERWAAIWRDHDGDAWPDLLHEECVLSNPMGQLARTDLPGYMANLVAGVSNHKLKPLRWGKTSDGVLIEWVMTGRLPGGEFEIHGADRFTLRDGRAVDGVAYFDPRPLIEALT